MSTVEDIKQKTDIVDVVSGYTKLMKSGRNYKGLCPFHSEKTPSFFIFPEQQSWHCFGACGTGGDVISFLMRKEGIDFGQALQLLAERTGIQIERSFARDDERGKLKELAYSINTSAAEYFHKLLLEEKEGETAREYISSRGLSNDIVEKFLLGFCRNNSDDLCRHLMSIGYTENDLLSAGLALRNDDGSIHDRFKNRLVFPINDYQGHVIGFGARSLDKTMPKYVNSPQTMLFDKSGCVYGLDKAKSAIRNKNNVIITEGYMDVLTSHQYGWENTVASMGTALTEKQLGIIKKFTSNVILALDSDAAGEEATLRVAESVDMENYFNADVKVIATPGGKDPDEVIRNDPGSWENAVQNAILLVDFVIDVVKEKYDLKTISGKQLAVEEVLPMVGRIQEPIRRGEYIQRLSKVINIKEEDLRDQLKKQKDNQKKRKFGKKPEKMLSSGTVTIQINSIDDAIKRQEDTCLGMLLKYPELREVGLKSGMDVFESAENIEIFTTWVQYEDIDKIKMYLDDSLLSHLNNILSLNLRAMDEMNDAKRIYSYYDSVDKLYEMKIKRTINKIGDLLQSTEEGIEEELFMLEERGKALKKIFNDRKQRKQIAA